MELTSYVLNVMRGDSVTRMTVMLCHGFHQWKRKLVDTKEQEVFDIDYVVLKVARQL
jgi:hypothetical protein